MIEEFKNYLIDKKLEDNSYNSYISDLKQYMKYYEDSYGEKLNKLIYNDVKSYINYLKFHLKRKPTTINRHLVSLKTYNEFLVKKGIQNDIVISQKDSIKIQVRYDREDVPSDKDINLLRHISSENKRDFCFIVISAYGGPRAEEMVTILIDNIDMDKREIGIYGKGNKYRRIIINDLMYLAIDEYLKERKQVLPENPYLFVGKKSNFYQNKPMARNFSNRLLNKYNDLIKKTRNSEIENLHPHALRSFFCTTAGKVGYRIEQVAEQAGHSSINTTRRYMGKDNKSLHELSNKMC